ncbi:type IV pilin protein [Candidatus Venteria ishoeyi]|uniref:Fimbrial protein n=1 Tax=Candidatus Venteria ishoeyi TaxID=1899563 RepID=A0A1H6F6C2_9GAMM|nr:type IV pilin protein [Candidatus Venteria ishoeyi]SEH04921.1 Fimbrial protein precursor [Candidatus Venteria ishoeyi]
MKHTKQRGFTLIEIMIVIGVIGILMAIAIPQFQQYVIKSKRVDAKVALTSLVQLQESFYTNKGNTYTTDLKSKDGLACEHKGICDVKDGNVLSLDGHYILTVESLKGDTAPTANDLLAGFQVRATATGAQKKDDETKCASLALNSKNKKSSKNGAGNENEKEEEECW